MDTKKLPGTLTPNVTQSDVVDDVHNFLARTRDAGESLYVCRAHSSDDNSIVELPPEIADLFASIIATLREGQGVTVVPIDKRVTTQEAADILGVSRPTLIKMLQRGDLPYTTTGKHRRIAFVDVMEYRTQRRAALQGYLAETALEDDELGTPDEVSAALRESRKRVAHRVAEHGKR